MQISRALRKYVQTHNLPSDEAEAVSDALAKLRVRKCKHLTPDHANQLAENCCGEAFGAMAGFLRFVGESEWTSFSSVELLVSCLTASTPREIAQAVAFIYAITSGTHRLRGCEDYTLVSPINLPTSWAEMKAKVAEALSDEVRGPLAREEMNRLRERSDANPEYRVKGDIRGGIWYPEMEGPRLDIRVVVHMIQLAHKAELLQDGDLWFDRLGGFRRDLAENTIGSMLTDWLSIQKHQRLPGLAVEEFVRVARGLYELALIEDEIGLFEFDTPTAAQIARWIA